MVREVHDRDEALNQCHYCPLTVCGECLFNVAGEAVKIRAQTETLDLDGIAHRRAVRLAKVFSISKCNDSTITSSLVSDNRVGSFVQAIQQSLVCRRKDITRRLIHVHLYPFFSLLRRS